MQKRELFTVATFSKKSTWIGLFRRLLARPSLLTTELGFFYRRVSVFWHHGMHFWLRFTVANQYLAHLLTLFSENRLLRTCHTFLCDFHIVCSSRPLKYITDLCSSLEHSFWLVTILKSLKINIFVRLKSFLK